MRKTLPSALLAAFCAILLAAPLEGGGVMSIGMRNAMLAGGSGWKNPYVTDGLIAMWDGEWNAGPGKHDANATEWKDCAQGYIATTTDTAYTWGSNYCSSPSFRFFCPVYVGEMVNAATRSKAFTIECVFSSPDATSNVRAFAICNGSNMYDRIDLNNAPNNVLTCNFNSTTETAFQVPGVVNRFAIPTRFVYTPVTGGVEALVVNATTNLSITNTVSIPDTVNRINEFTLGRQSTVTTKNTTLYRIAFYSRALNAAEIAANYAVDKARFNLT